MIKKHRLVLVHPSMKLQKVRLFAPLAIHFVALGPLIASTSTRGLTVPHAQSTASQVAFIHDLAMAVNRTFDVTVGWSRPPGFFRKASTNALA